MSSYVTLRSQFTEIRQQYRPHSSGNGRAAMLYPGVITSPGNGTNYGTSEYPYSEDETRNNSDILMFPVLAGTLVMAYNIPELSNTLTLTMDHVVGIYNGTYTWWNDTAFKIQNPNSTFPNASIKPVVRYFPAGSTYIFTKCLSVHSRFWNQSYGTFWEKSYWNGSINFEYGHRSVGMGDTITSLAYSIGYVPVWLAESVNLRYATIVNRIGSVTSPKSMRNLLNSMDSNRQAIFSTRQLISNLIETAPLNTYPIIGYSYMIVRLASSAVCPEVVNLARYIEWLTTSQQAREIASSFGMSTVTKDMATGIENRVLNRFICGKYLVKDLLSKQKQEEERKTNSWKVPFSVSVSIFLLVLVGLVAVGLHQRKKFIKMIDRDDWKIDSSDIEYIVGKRSSMEFASTDQIYSISSINNTDNIDTNTTTTATTNTVTTTTTTTITTAAATNNKNIQNNNNNPIKNLKKTISHNLTKFQMNLSGGSQSKPTTQLAHPKSTRIFGKYKDVGMCFSEMWLGESFSANFKVRQVLNRMRNSIENENLARFYGLTLIGERLYIAEEFCEKGNLIGVLKHAKYKLDDNFRYSISKDLLQGLAYLHRNEITHGLLTTDCCVVNSRWAVKITSWCYNLIHQTGFSSSGGKKFTKSLLTIYKEGLKESEKSQFEFWLPPEVYFENGQTYQATRQSDIFNFGLILFKIFSTSSNETSSEHDDQTLNQPNRDDSDKPIQVPRLAKLATTRSLPPKVKFIIERACLADTLARPNAEKLSYMLRSAQASRKNNILDNIVETIEKYGNEMETRASELQVKLKNYIDERDKFLSKTFPSWTLRQIHLGNRNDSRLHKSLTVLAIKIWFQTNQTISGSDIPSGNYENYVRDCIDEFSKNLDDLLDENSWLFKIDQTSTSVVLIAGFNGMPVGQNVGKMVQLSFAYRKSMEKMMTDVFKRYSPTYTLQNAEACTSPIRLGTTLHTGPVYFYVNYDPSDLTLCKFVAHGEALTTATKINESFGISLNKSCTVITDELLKHLPVSVKNIRVQSIPNAIEDINLYWIEPEIIKREEKNMPLIN
ncbi:hypothetical protein HELRODRAFT_194445 [Helobdella robusta]|uniref:Protein kinase domain-containing protein n=1 Tax=Helobdella robusta TaxID=6412 RepID=T1FW23_HELRO|nr:hypothetical protein HELRODRAFT_194445 [Helobdella robusta]ESN92080.1 hypothetical protein HELRODRAFT_194445 [Helobdella robusta]